MWFRNKFDNFVKEFIDGDDAIKRRKTVVVRNEEIVDDDRKNGFIEEELSADESFNFD